MAVDDAGDRRPALVADRVGQLLVADRELRLVGHELRRDRVVRFAALDQRRHVRGHGDSELLGHPPNRIEPLRRDEAGGDEVFDPGQTQTFLMIGIGHSRVKWSRAVASQE